MASRPRETPCRPQLGVAEGTLRRAGSGPARTGRRGLWASLSIIAAVGVAAAWSQPTAAADIIIGAGQRDGVDYRVGRAICRLVNKGTAEHGLTCSVLDTPGSLFNLSNVRGGAIELGLVRSDSQYHAVNRSGPFRFVDVDYGNLRSLFSVQGEPFTVVARRDSGIRSLANLKGHRVNIGNPGSGQRMTMERVMAAMGWTKADFLLAEELPASQQSLALCHDRVQAMVQTVSHPDATVGQAVGLCDAALVEVSGPAIDKLVAGTPYYAHLTIPGGLYRDDGKPVASFGVRTTVVSSADIDAETIYHVVTAVFEDLSQFKRTHPALAELEPARMVREGLTAPVHEGALKYYGEAGLR